MPTLQVSSAGVLLDGRLVAPGIDPETEAEPQPILALSDALHQRRASNSTAAIGEIALQVDPNTPACLLSSVLWTGREAGAGGFLIHGSGGTLSLHANSPINKWIEPDPGQTDVVLLVGQTRISVAQLTDAVRPDNAQFNFDVVGRETMVSSPHAYDSIRSWTRKACENSTSPCPRAVQVQNRAALSSGEWIALLNAATSWKVPAVERRDVVVTILSAATAGKTSRVPTILFHRIIDHQKAAFRKCYEDAVGGDLTAIGRVVMKLTLNETGAVSEVSDVTERQSGRGSEYRPSAGQPLMNMVARKCVANQYAQLRFPAPPDGTLTFTWPMFFSPGPREQVSEELQ